MQLNWQRYRLVLGLTIALVLGSWGAIATPVRAAETVVVRKGIASVSVAVDDLREFARTGKIPVSLAGYGTLLSPEQRRQVLEALNINLSLDRASVQNLLNTQIGETILDGISTVTAEPGGEALKGALIASAEDPQGLSVLGFLEAYPNPELRIDLDAAFAIFARLNRSFWQTQQFMVEMADELEATTPDVAVPFDPTQPGAATVEVIPLQFEDEGRNRTILADLYWSQTVGSDRPLVVFTHGRGSVRNELDYLARHLASHGFGFLALEHPGSNQVYIDRALALQPEELLERPRDISFVLDELAAGVEMDPQIRRSLNPERVLAIGYSLGGSTALAIAGGEFQLESLRERCRTEAVRFSVGQITQCIASQLPEDRYRLYDPRVKAAIALNPTASLLFGETGLARVEVPTLIFSVSADKLTPALSDQIGIFPQLRAPKWLVGVVGGTHLSVKDPAFVKDQSQRPNTPLSGNEVFGVATADIRNYAKAFTLAMAAQLTPDAREYEIFLTPEYFRSISTDAFPVRLVTEIPDEIQVLVEAFLEKN
ncbi:alpha/beta fold hydrolase [Lyngbya sp. CCY1209]|uniref:alpha/beta hydrolase n=1 Tax=Lyngbya sp. CCY1209 TaxID=2886103 RepID=UPI002D20CB95|nr:alpha/beta fold hydrolase [Lyngbya sp. CCY1209]MEB3882189.1 alpha/beta hydrolase [Lyngbya sp. CCY1209]